MLQMHSGQVPEGEEAQEAEGHTGDHRHYYRCKFLSNAYHCRECNVSLASKWATFCNELAPKIDYGRDDGLICDECFPMHLVMCALAN
jgi:hypothetical protein